MTNEIYQAALDYQQNGFSVIPILPGAKEPPIKWKEFQNRIPSIEEINVWWKQWPKANVAIICGEISGIDCLDADGPHALDNLEGQSGVKLPDTVSEFTGRKDSGKHLIFKYHGGGLKNWKGFAGNGNGSQCDLRTNGGYFVAAPSIHKSGKKYEWICDPLIEDPEPFPPKLIKFISDWHTKTHNIDSGREKVDPEKWFKDGIPDGSKYGDFFRYACMCISRNMAFDEVVILLEELGNRCNPPPKEGAKAAALKLATEAFNKYGDQSKPVTPDDFDNLDGPETISARDLIDLEIPPIKWAVDGLIAEGLTILAGKPKMGKSLMALNICSSVAKGTKALNFAECEEGAVLYLALEDVKRRLQSRLNTMFMIDILGGDSIPDNLHLAFEWKRMGQGGIKALKAKIESIPNIKMVVVDTLKMFRPAESEKKSVYNQDYDPISALKKVADEYNVAVVVIHHLRKSAGEDIMDTLSGSFGLTGASDTNAVLERSSASTAEAILHIAGRDVEAAEYALTFDPTLMSWNILGNAHEIMGTKRQQLILDAIKEGCISQADVRKETGLKQSNVKKTFKKLLSLGKIRKTSHGEYELADIDDPMQRTSHDEVPF